MTDIVQMSKDGTNFYPQTHAQAVLGLPDSVGTNLLLDSQTQMRKPSWYTQNNIWTEDWGTYLGSNIYRAKYSWDNVRYSYKELLDRGIINTTDDFTYSIYFRVVGEDPAELLPTDILFYSAATTKGGSTPLGTSSLKEGQWTRLVISFKFNDFKYDPTQEFNNSIRIEVTVPPKVDGAWYEFAAPKLEKGSVATYHSVNPEDILSREDVQTAITNALSDVKTQIQDSTVGTNLLLKTDVPFSMTGSNINNQYQQMYALSRRLEKGTTVTISFDAVSTAFANFTIQTNGTDGGTWTNYIASTVDTTKKHYVATITLDGFSELGVNLRLDNVPSTTTITISNMKLQLGLNTEGVQTEIADQIKASGLQNASDVQTAITNALSDVNAKVKELETKIDKLSPGKQ